MKARAARTLYASHWMDENKVQDGKGVVENDAKWCRSGIRAMRTPSVMHIKMSVIPVSVDVFLTKPLSPQTFSKNVDVPVENLKCSLQNVHMVLSTEIIICQDRFHRDSRFTVHILMFAFLKYINVMVAAICLSV